MHISQSDEEVRVTPSSTNMTKPFIEYIDLNKQIYSMDNPEQLSLSPQLMHAYDTHRNIPWNDPQYQPPKVYEDPIKQITERKYQQTEKGGSPQNYVTKRGFYMDYHIKVVKALPSPVDHTFKDPWDQAENKKKSQQNKLDLSLSKYSYLDLIATEEKNRAKPAPGAYNLNKTDDDIRKHIEDLKSRKRYQGGKHLFYEDTEYLSNRTPGMGAYNPHDEVSHLRLNKTAPKFWIEKHKKEGERVKRRRSVEPAPGTHTPIPLGYTTFDRIMTADLVKRQKKEKQVFHGFGSDEKFEYARPNKKKILEVRPAPSAYNMVLEWKGKEMDLKANNWVRARSLGRSQSVYH